ncbi:DUF4956 domain-containing protein [bacterium]|nr:DUF4956 domain-containing protein [bacterium]
MFNEFQSWTLFPPSVSDIAAPVLAALVCGLWIAWLYKVTYQGPGFSQNFFNSLILLPMITSLVIMVIGNNLARAFGLVGALSIIRFRTALKEPLDIVYVFFAMAVGMAAGIGSYQVAFFGSMVIGSALAVLTRSRQAVSARREYLLQLLFEPTDNEPPSYLAVLEEHCRRFEVLAVKSAQETTLLELSFYIDLRDRQDGDHLVRALRTLPSIRQVNLFFEDQSL